MCPLNDNCSCHEDDDEQTVTPKTGHAGKPIKRRGHWTYVSHPWNGPVWRLDGTTLDLEYDPLDHSAAIPGCWVLYRNGRYDSPIDHYLDGAMKHVEREHRRRHRRVTETVVAL